ncbi:MAG: hypothetical protein IKS48_01530 [Eubacterium sp.]|nr:hypothetical protein [Eubacterium sp.]
MKRWRKIILGIFIILVVFMGMILYLSEFHLDLSQDYRRVGGYENIVFKDPRSDQCFRLCVWGLMKTENKNVFKEHRNPDITSYEYQLLAENADAENVWQLVPSPDGRYILYVERIYRGTGITDDEDVYYRVYSTADKTSVTIYSGFKQFLLVDWK